MGKKMKAQTPARSIMSNGDFGDSKAYTITCECQSNNHDVHMWIELNGDEDGKDIEMIFYVNTTTPFWREGFNRFKTAWNILINGYHESQHTLLLNKQGAMNVASTITKVVKELEGKK